MEIKKYTAYDIALRGRSVSPNLNRDDYYKEEFVKLSDIEDLRKEKRKFTNKDGIKIF